MNIFHTNNLFKTISTKYRKINNNEYFVYFAIDKGVRKCKFNINTEECIYIKDLLLPNIDIISNKANNNTNTNEYLLDFYLIPNTNYILLAGGVSKKIIVYEEIEYILVFEYIHNKKLSNCLIMQENEIYYSLFSDKFGEIYIVELKINNNMNIANDNNDKVIENKAYLLYGHAEVVSYLIKTEKYLISSDSLSKIKICNFPNVFEIKTCLLYDSYRYISTISDNYLLVVNNNLDIHIWELDNHVQRIESITYKLNTNLKSIIVENDCIYFTDETSMYVLKFDKTLKELKKLITLDINKTNISNNNNNNINQSNQELKIKLLNSRLLVLDNKNNQSYLFDSFDENNNNLTISLFKKIDV